MASNDNPVSRLNEFCQRNKLTLSFEKINDNQLCLTIGRQGFQEYIQFTGEGRTLKLAKCDAAEKAFKAGIINELKKVAAGESAASRSGDLVARFGRFTLKDGGQDPIYEAYLVARAHNLPFFIEFRNVRRGVSQTKLSVIVRLGNTKTEGSGANDLEAIYAAASKIDLDAIKKHPDGQRDESSDDGARNALTLGDSVNSSVDYSCLAQMGSSHDPLFILKCTVDNKVSYGLGNNKRTAKNKAAFRMLEKMKMTEKESIQINMQSMETGRWSDCDRIREIVYREENAIYKLEDIDDVRSHTLKFIESGKEIGVQLYFTTECRLLDGPDLKIHTGEIAEKNKLEKNGLVYLRTSARCTNKKASKIEAAEKMINLIRGEGAFTNEEARMNRQLAEYNKMTFNLTDDRIDGNRVSRECRAYLAEMSRTAFEFLADKPNYDPDFDYLAELQDMEFAFRGVLKLEIKSSNEIYKLFSNAAYNPFVSAIVKFHCEIVMSAVGKAENEIEAKNIASYDLLKKLAEIRKIFVSV